MLSTPVFFFCGIYLDTYFVLESKLLYMFSSNSCENTQFSIWSLGKILSSASLLVVDLIMDNGELDYLNHETFFNPNIYTFDMDDMLRDTHACTHTHTCNQPGPEFSHTHTCFHVHTKIVSAPADDKDTTEDTAESTEKGSKKGSLGNREAVRKYREKKKARAASLEDEVMRLRTLNQQLMKRLQGQAALEAEVARLKCLLVDIRGRIEGEIGSFPYQKLGKGGDGISNPAQHLNLSSGGYVLNPCDLRCDDQDYCMQPGVEGKGGEVGGLNGQQVLACDIGSVQCMGNPSLGSREPLGCGSGNAGPATGLSYLRKRKGGCALTED